MKDNGEKSIIRRFLEDDEFRRIHAKWALENEEILRKDRNAWNFGIIVRNHTVDAFDLMIERVIKLYEKDRGEKANGNG